MILLLGLARRVFYLELSPVPAACGSLIYCTVTLGGLYVAYYRHWLSPLSALLMMGLGGLVSSALLFIYLKSRLPSSGASPSLRETFLRHWEYGRWALAGYAMMWIPANIFYPLVGSLAGIAKAGQLKALMNLPSPLLQTYAALSPLLLPYAVRVLERKGTAGADSLMRWVGLFSISSALVYWAVLLLFSGPVFRLLYSGKYQEVIPLLPVAALASISNCAFFGPALVLRAMKSPVTVFTAVCVSVCISLAIGVPATRALGVKGAAWSIAASELIGFVMAFILLRRKLRKPLPDLAESETQVTA